MDHEVRQLLDFEGIHRGAEGERLDAECGDIRAHVVATGPCMGSAWGDGGIVEQATNPPPARSATTKPASQRLGMGDLPQIMISRIRCRTTGLGSCLPGHSGGLG